MRSEPILHVDMDAFYAAVEVRDNPALAGRPVAVGGPGHAGGSRRGVVAACSYEARRYGVTSAMPIGMARQLCPRLVVIAPRMGHYAAISAQLHDIFADYTDQIAPISLDEAWLDVTDTDPTHGSSVDIAATIRRRVADELGLACSAGVARSRWTAKIASSKAKPDGLLHIPADDTDAFLLPLPVSDLWGVGPVATQTLAAAGITTIADARAAGPGRLRALLGDAAGRRLHLLIHDADTTPVRPPDPPQSFGRFLTLAHNTRSDSHLAHAVTGLMADVVERLHADGRAARTVCIAVRYADRTDITRQQTLQVATDSTDTLTAVAGRLMAATGRHQPIRGVGVSVTGLSPAAQLALPLPP